MTDPLEQLRALFVDRCRSDMERLGRLSPDDPEVGVIAHRLAGSGGSFGYPEISEAAAAVDERARRGPPLTRADLRDLTRSLEAAIGPAPEPRPPQ